MAILWVNPTGFVLNGWANGELGYDDDVATGASIDIASDVYTPFIEFTHEPMLSNRTNLYYKMSVSVTHTVDVDAYYNDTWNHVFENLIPQNATVQVVMASAKIVSAFRFRFLYSQPATPTGVLTLCEVNFYAYAPTITTQAVSDILQATAVANGTITYTNGDNATIRGFQYGLTATPTWDAHEHGSFGAVAFSLPITGLDSNTKYYIRAYATNGVGTSYGDWVSFTTLSAITIPVVSTPAVSDILMITATGNGNITDTGGENATKRGICYNLTGSPTVADSKVEETGSFETGAFTGAITGLTLGTKYYVKAYAYNSAGYGYGEEVNFTTLIPVVTTEAAEVPVPVSNPAYCEFADGNGTIVSEVNATERGFEVKHEVSGTLFNDIDHGMAGFAGDADWDIDLGWHGTLTKVEKETGDFEEGAFTLTLGDFPAFAFDKLFAGESYSYRAYAIIGGITYYGEWVDFSLGVYEGEGLLPNTGGGDSPFVPIIDPVPLEEPYSPFPPEEKPPFVWPEVVFPPWEWPPVDKPPLGIDPSIIFGKAFGAFLRGLDTKEDWKTLREKCIIYQENMNQDTLAVNHNTLVTKNLVSDIIKYVDGDVYPSDLRFMDSSQHLTPLYQEDISPDGFKDIINDFRLKDVCNTFTMNENFIKILNSLNSLYESDYRIEPISYNTMEYIDIQPTAKRMILQLGDMDDKFKEVRRLIILNFKRIFSYV